MKIFLTLLNFGIADNFKVSLNKYLLGCTMKHNHFNYHSVSLKSHRLVGASLYQKIFRTSTYLWHEKRLPGHCWSCDKNSFHFCESQILDFYLIPFCKFQEFIIWRVQHNLRKIWRGISGGEEQSYFLAKKIFRIKVWPTQIRNSC